MSRNYSPESGSESHLFALHSTHSPPCPNELSTRITNSSKFVVEAEWAWCTKPAINDWIVLLR